MRQAETLTKRIAKEEECQMFTKEPSTAMDLNSASS